MKCLLFSIIFKTLILFCMLNNNVNSVSQESSDKSANTDFIINLTDEKWDQIQKGKWLIGFFDKETPESKKLDGDWEIFSLKCQDYGIKVGRVFAPSNPSLYVRFLVTVFPKVFYIKNGVAHEVPKVSREVLMNLIKEEKWSDLKPVNFLSNPFSVQMSLLSHLFVHAVNLYNYEQAIVQKFTSYSSVTDIVFGLTFIIVGTFLGLCMTVTFGIIQIIWMDKKESDEKSKDKKKSDDKDEKKSDDKEKKKGDDKDEKKSGDEKKKPEKAKDSLDKSDLRRRRNENEE